MKTPIVGTQFQMWGHMSFPYLFDSFGHFNRLVKTPQQLVNHRALIGIHPRLFQNKDSRQSRVKFPQILEVLNFLVAASLLRLDRRKSALLVFLRVWDPVVVKGR